MAFLIFKGEDFDFFHVFGKVEIIIDIFYFVIIYVKKKEAV